MKITVLITCAGGELVPQFFRMLKASERHTVKIIAVDMNPQALGQYFADHFETVPAAASPDYLNAIEMLCQRFDVDVILPLSDEEAFALSAARERLEAPDKRVLACADHAITQILMNKAATYERLASAGIAVPQWKKVEALSDLPLVVETMLQSLGSVVVKPATARGGRDVCVIDSSIQGEQPHLGGRERHIGLDTFIKDHLKKYADSLPVIVMQRLQEPVYDLDLLSWQGEPIHVIPRRRRNSAVANEGHLVTADAGLMALGRAVVKALNLSFLLDCDVMIGEDGQPYVLEVNPRPSGSVTVSMTAGIPLLDDLIILTQGGSVLPIVLKEESVIIPFKSLQREPV